MSLDGFRIHVGHIFLWLITFTNFQTTFDSPPGDDPVALNLSAMGKGEAWVNGQSIGRYWVSLLTAQGKPSQTL